MIEGKRESFDGLVGRAYPLEKSAGSSFFNWILPNLHKPLESSWVNTRVEYESLKGPNKSLEFGGQRV